MKVLIVEDDVLTADYISILVEDAGHAVVGTAHSAAEALDLLERGLAADVASLDVRLPGGMDGVELATILCSRYNLPFLFVTGSGDPAHRRRCEALGPLAILQKPLSPATLTQLLDSVDRARSSAR
jgi:CheY-like chemotaxis protein